MPHTALIGAFLAGLLGGFHCVAMCGGWLAALRTPSAAAPLRPASVLRTRLAASHLGRIVTYMTIGAVFGGAGGAAFATTLAPVQTALYVAANVMLLLLALSMAVRGFRFAWAEHAGLGLYRRVLPAVARLAQGSGARSRFALGLAWGLTPCALVYSVLPVAMLAGGAVNGALVMLAFGLGTLPNLLAASWTLTRTGALTTGPAARYAAAMLVAAFALAGLYRAWFVPDALGQGPFCISVATPFM